MREAAVALVAKLAAEVEVERRKERAAIVEATSTHMAIGTHYWEQRYAAERKLRAAQALVDALT